jgi:GPH family glycoside/pentoside/hexuronide:cation symporter
MTKEERKLEKQQDKLPRGYLPASAAGGIAKALNNVIMLQITFYATDVTGLNAALVGTLLLASKIFDGFTDLLIGFIVDRTNTRWGRARPYQLFIVPLWLLTILLYSMPDMGTFGKAVYLFVLYTLNKSVCMTALDGTGAIYLARSLSGSQRHGKVISYTGVIVMFFAGASSILLPQLIKAWGSQPGGWTKISLLYGVPMIAMGLYMFFGIKETNSDSELDRKNTFSLKESLKLVMKNKYIIILSVAGLTMNIPYTLTSSSSLFYFTYFIGDVGIMSFIGLFSFLAPLSMLFFPLAMKTIGAMNFIRAGLALAVVGDVAIFFAGANIPVLLICGFLSAVGKNTLLMVIGVFLIQCMDYGEWHTGKRVEGIVNSFHSFASKVGSGVASALVGAILGLSGYVAQAAQQTPSAIFGIRSLFSLIPAAGSLITLVILMFFDLDKKIGKIAEDLKARKAAANSPEETA